MSIRIGDTAPDFSADTTHGNIKFHDWLGSSWGVLFSHPADFTPVCTTELGELARIDPEFQKRNVKVIAISVDTVEDHNKWVQDVNKVNNVTVGYPIIADKDRQISKLYGMLDQTHLDDQTGLPLTVRAVFIIDPSKKIRLIIVYPASTGRNFVELIRVIDSLQLSSKQRVTTPANWKQGDEVIIHPAVEDDEAKKLFGDFKTLTPYLRMAKQPVV
eukprot:TRINITY_DN10294_c0_g1_i1.p1 TRINITY_DN10294_c0_g1~~TRINITY_DN10294_c0_g1_i1.p1  ORF type:complete len:216 (+),score=45.24 TRINITY_DN10294_c0_g1_i1:183-830(+)